MAAEENPLALQRQITRDALKATQEELSAKNRELQIYEANHLQLKKDVARWKKKFEYTFRENELLSLETTKLDASYKQIAFLQQEIKFKEEEAQALKGLIGALEASNKKARAAKLEQHATASYEAQQQAKKEQDLAALEDMWANRVNSLEHEINALKGENASLVQDLNRSDAEAKSNLEELAAQRSQIAALEANAAQEVNEQREKLREAQEMISNLEKEISDLKAEKANRNNSDGVTPPGTPPDSLSPKNRKQVAMTTDDLSADTIIQKWTTNNSIRAATDAEYSQSRLAQFLDTLPGEYRERTSALLMDAISGTPRVSFANSFHNSTYTSVESQILIEAVSLSQQKELTTFVVPLLKAHHHIKVKYATQIRQTHATDIKITIQPRDESFLGVPGSRTSTPGYILSQSRIKKKPARFGSDHTFYGPASSDLVNELVLHNARFIDLDSQDAIYVSLPNSTAEKEEESEESQVALPNENQAKGPMKFGRLGGLGNMMGTARTRLKTMASLKATGSLYTHEGTTCQFCKTTPIQGAMYSCAVCVGFNMCQTCYSLGGHGMENSNALFNRAQELSLAKCPRLGEEIELLELLRYEICRSNLRKFKFCLSWLADILIGKTSKDLSARALEIPNIPRGIRKQFVPMLMRLCADREDIDVRTEWEVQDEQPDPKKHKKHYGSRRSEGSDSKVIETLRIWVADQFRSTSPFVERTLLEFRTGDVEEEEPSDEEPMMHSKLGDLKMDAVKEMIAEMEAEEQVKDTNIGNRRNFGTRQSRASGTTNSRGDTFLARQRKDKRHEF